MQTLVCYDVDNLKSTCNTVSNFSRKFDIHNINAEARHM